MFKNNKDINFPIPVDSNSSASVLVESFAEGVPITYYEHNKHILNKVIARIGALTFF
jgi:predicted unusual protein kinase regulating ubiquinone biosynthesis (AarF/ABC1/UbiB family)